MSAPAIQCRISKKGTVYWNKNIKFCAMLCWCCSFQENIYRICLWVRIYWTHTYLQVGDLSNGSFLHVCFSMMPSWPQKKWCCFFTAGGFHPIVLHVYSQLVTNQTWSTCLCRTWVFPKIGVPQNGWFTMEKPIKLMIWGYHYFWKHPHP